MADAYTLGMLKTLLSGLVACALVAGAGAARAAWEDTPAGLAYIVALHELQVQQMAPFQALDKEIAAYDMASFMSAKALTEPPERARALSAITELRALLPRRQAALAAVFDRAREFQQQSNQGPNRQVALAAFDAQAPAVVRGNAELDAAQLAVLDLAEEMLWWASRQTGFGAVDGRLAYDNAQQKAEFDVFRKRLPALRQTMADAAERNAAVRAVAERDFAATRRFIEARR